MAAAPVWKIVRVGVGCFFLAVGIIVLAFVVTGALPPPRQPNAQAQAFADALTATGFIDPLLAASYVAGGGALLFDRTAPLGIALLGPAVTVIILFHFILSGQWVIGLIVAAVYGALVWKYRARFAALWTYAE